MDDLRKQLTRLLSMKGAHLDFDAAVRDFPAKLRGVKPQGAAHTPWQLLEHLRIAQWDILEFSRDANHKSPEFPDGYWPDSEAPPDEAAWEESIGKFRHDLEELKKLAADEKNDLHARIPHGEGQTLLREILTAADHNAYHLGQFVFLRTILAAS